MQNYTNIPPSQTLTDSRQPLLNNDLTAMTCSSGSAFPTAYALVGTLCLRTDSNRLYQLRQMPATTDSNWHLIADLNQDYTYKSYVDSNFALQTGSYAGLRAQATTKTDVGLSEIPNAITASLSIDSNSYVASARASFALNNLIAGLDSRLTTAETTLTGKANTNGSVSEYFVADTLYAATTINCNGDVVAEAGVVIPSDRRLKKDIAPIDDGLERLSCFTGVTYTLKSNEKECVGLIAQEVEESIPESVRYHNGHLALDYGSLGGVFVSAINELRARVERLEAINAEL